MDATKLINNAYDVLSNGSNIAKAADQMMYYTTTGTDTWFYPNNLTVTAGTDLVLGKKIIKEVNSKPNMDSADKFYRVLQDTPAWLKGALIYKIGEQYVAHTELFNQEWTSPKYYESANIVENAPAFFARVYRVKQDGKVKFLSKEDARKVVEEAIKNA